MDKYVVPQKPSPPNPKPIPRKQWNRGLIELNGRMEPKYCHSVSGLLTESYSQIGAFPHLYHINGEPCPSHSNRIQTTMYPLGVRNLGFSALDFDNKGIYLASVTKAGCLTVHDFEALYCQSYASNPCLAEDESKLVLHLPSHRQRDCVRWNPANQDEVVCTSMLSDEVLVFDIGYISSQPSQVLRIGSSFSCHSITRKGLSDVAFTLDDNSRLLASDTSGDINVWDRRMSALPYLELTTPSYCTLNSIESNVENQIIFGAGKNGVIYMWDLRGGRASSAFQSHREFSQPSHRPLASFKLASFLEKISPLKAQSDIVAKSIHSIDLDPSCPYQLAFHLDDGWSGVLNLYNFQVTHIHCPPPAWLNESYNSACILSSRKPSWLPTNSIYVVGSSSENGIHLLDFYPDSSSPTHVDYNEDERGMSGPNNQTKRNRFLPLTEGVTACAVHPLNGTIVAGTKLSSLLMISQSHQPC
ncbi:uncharacterized protein LOC107412617 [Ziziphus jujuba]|uniref:Uncharacterized protein LOC107412617 n=1 Tax=Ziziphus jujuba TaxID=326968 RepID=A0ABM3I9Y4_ZIZJJ|nr:uncharacterized protein LOC107412617 [Ziziphus jujuba]